MKLFIAGCLCALAATGIAAAQSLSIIPISGAPQTYTVTFHSDEPHPHEGGFYQVGGFYLGGPGADPALEDAPDYLRDQKGTMTLTRTASTVTVTTQGALDSFYSPVAILAHGVLDPGGPPERFVLAFDNALACFSAMPSTVAMGTSWNGSIRALTGVDALGTVPIAMTTVAVNGADVTAQGTGQANLTITIGDNDQPATFDVAVNGEVSGGRLVSYTEKITRTVTNNGHTAKLNTAMTIAASSPSPIPSVTP